MPKLKPILILIPIPIPIPNIPTPKSRAAFGGDPVAAEVLQKCAELASEPGQTNEQPASSRQMSALLQIRAVL